MVGLLPVGHGAAPSQHPGVVLRPQTGVTDKRVQIREDVIKNGENVNCAVPEIFDRI